MENIEKLRPFASKFIGMFDRGRLRKRGLPCEQISEEEELSRDVIPQGPGVRTEGEYVPRWLINYLSNPEVKPGTVEDMRKLLSKLKTPLSDAVLEERYGEDEK